MADLSELKISIFPGINDTPRAATSTKAGNGSDIIQRFNSLVGVVEEMENRMSSIETTIQSLALKTNTLEAKINSIAQSSNDGGSNNLPNTGDDEMANWIIVNSDYDAGASSKVLFANYAQEITVYLPYAPAVGSAVKFLKGQSLGTNYPISINLNEAKYSGQSNKQIKLVTNFKEVEFAFVDYATGWIATDETPLDISTAVDS